MSSAHSLSPGISFFTRNKRRMHKYGIIIAFFALCLIVALIGEYQVAHIFQKNPHFVMEF